MRTLFIAAAVVGLALPALAQTIAASDEAAIRRVVQQHDDLRNTQDWTALREIFTSDADQLTSSGEWRRGRDQIAKGNAQIVATTYKGGKYATKVESMRMVAPAVAIANAAFEISGIQGGARRGHTTYILSKADGQWRIAATRSMVTLPAGPSPTR